LTKIPQSKAAPLFRERWNLGDCEKRPPARPNRYFPVPDGFGTGKSLTALWVGCAVARDLRKHL